ncbi:hypothetical protein FACS1894142_8320 [Spirochaetia bacterium]|nr:hypothetical protein FACS1894142_8320 [Spirochaetia bacterium]
MDTTLTPIDGHPFGTNRVIRGGSWFDAASSFTLDLRNQGPPNYRDTHSGFRVVSK